jgi:replication-associated recombination protein RarA
MERQRFYRPTERGAEAAIAERLRRFEALRARRARGR